MTSSLLASQASRLQQQVNEFQTRFGCLLIVENILQALIDHYTTVTVQPSMPLTARFYAYQQSGAIWGAVPDEAVHAICSLWLRQLAVKEVIIQGARFMLRLHPNQVLDGKPLVLLIPQLHATAHSAPDPNQQLYVRERLPARTHSHLLKNHPKLPGCILDPQKVAKWASDANLLSAQDVSTWSGHPLLETLSAHWLNRAPKSPPSATLTADSVVLREFILCMAKHPAAGCHFTLRGQTELCAYLVLTESGGTGQDLARIAIGTVAL